MTQIANFIHGIYPRSAKLVQTSRDVDRNRLSQKDLLKQEKADLVKLFKLQKSAAFDYIEDGKLSWQDIFRPIVLATQGLEVGALTRWFNNNSFFRQPIFSKKVRLNTGKLDDFFPNTKPSKKWKVTLPSPFTFAKLSEGDASFEERLAKTTEILQLIIKYLNKKGVSFIQLNEPYLPYHGANDQDLKLFIDSLKTLYKSKGNSLFAVHFYFGDAAPFVLKLCNEKLADVVGVDFYKTTLKSLPRRIPFDIIAGIVDGRNSLLENKAILRSFIKETLKRLDPKVLYIANNSDIEFLPEEVAAKKLLILKDVKTYFQK
ncbi:MAG: hypothetical protein HYT83_01950 [Candidatus Levybacteria bacterium]|nr:hypothetical protein [Candidatus Levybacteria bacterium]